MLTISFNFGARTTGFVQLREHLEKETFLKKCQGKPNSIYLVHLSSIIQSSYPQDHTDMIILFRNY